MTTVTAEPIQITDADGVRTITLNRPEKKNAITAAMYAAMADAVAGAHCEESIRVLLFTANGDAFSAGNDIGDFVNNPPLAGGDTPPVWRFLNAIATAQKPMIAAVRGRAVGVGLTMLLHCDLTYASETAMFSAPFADLGLSPEAGSSRLLPEALGFAKAGAVLLMGEVLTAAQADAQGLITRVIPDGDLDGFAADQARTLAAKPARAVLETKRLMRGDRSSLVELIAAEGHVFSALLQSEEFRQRAAAFMGR